MFFYWTLDEKDSAIIRKTAHRNSIIYFLYNMLVNIIIVVPLLLMLLETALVYLSGLHIKALLMAIIDCLIIYLIYLFNKSFKQKKTCKYIKKSDKHSCSEYTLSLENDEIILNNISYPHKEIAAVFLLNGYTVFTLKDKTYFILKNKESELYSYLKDTNLSVYAWCNIPTAKAAAKHTRKRFLKKVRPIIILILAFSIIWGIAPDTNKDNSDSTDTENAEVFTFDMNKDVYDQLLSLYEYYEVTHNFEATTDIYCSYINQAANVLSKTNYQNGDITKNKELLFINSNDFYYIKLSKQEYSDYQLIEIIGNGSTVTVQENEKGYTVTKSPNDYNYTSEDMYRVLTEYDYICKEYPLYKYACYYYGVVHLEFKSDKLFGKDSITYRMGEDNIAVYTESKDKEFKIQLQNIPQNDINDFIDVFTSLSSEADNSSLTFSQLINEINSMIVF